jgi:hypothetical protein
MKFSDLVRRLPKATANAIRDLRYGALLGGTKKTKYSDLGAHDTANSDYRDLADIFAEVPITPDDMIVDVGCGKGRAINWFLSQYPTNRIYGIELDEEVATATSKRLRHRRNVTILCGDAPTVLPATGNIFYLFNPFDEPVMIRFTHALRSNRTELPTTIVYNNAKYLQPFLSDSYFEVRLLDAPVRHSCAVIRLRGRSSGTDL